MNNSSRNQNKIIKNPQAYGSNQSEDRTLLKVTCHGVTTLSSSGGGVIDTFIPMDPSSLSGADFSDFISVYDEFRVMGCKITVTSIPINTANINNNLLVVGFDNDSAVAPGSFSVVQQLSTSKYTPCVWSSGELHKFIYWRPTLGVETNIPWIDVGNPTSSLGCIQVYASGLSASSAYMHIAIEQYVEFRGRR